MHMFRKKISDYLEKCGFLSHGYKLFAAALLVLGMAACSDDDNPVPEPDPEPEQPTSTFKLHIGEGNIVPMDLGAPDNYPPAYMAVLVMTRKSSTRVVSIQPRTRNRT